MPGVLAPDQGKFMTLALELAKRAAKRGEVPVGAVIVKEGQVLARAYNLRENQQSPLAHAELIAIQKAARVLKSWRLTGCDMYVTLEPCPMCAGALVQARLRRLIFAARDPKAGAVRSLFELADNPELNHRMEIQEGLMAPESTQLLKEFFSQLRNRKKIRR